MHIILVVVGSLVIFGGFMGLLVQANLGGAATHADVAVTVEVMLSGLVLAAFGVALMYLKTIADHCQTLQAKTTTTTEGGNQ